MRTAKISEVAHVTDFVASGSFASIKANVTYRSEKSYAILVRTTDYNNGWNGDYVWVDEHSFSFLSKSNLRPKDVIISNVGSIGIVFQTPDLGVPMSLAPNAIMCRSLDQDTLDQDFLYYYLKGPIGQHLIHSITSGSAQPKFNKTDFRNLEIKVPAIERQRYIGNILKSLDDKIELNSKMNETLEQMARALFKSWFVDFDPVHAKATGRQPAGMDKATADLFPSCFVDSELGKIPRGWRAASIYEISDVVYGAPFASGLFNTACAGRPLVRIRDLASEEPAVFTTEVHPKGYLLKPGDIAVGMDGEFRAYLWAGQESWLNQRVCVFAPKPGFSNAFVRNSIIRPLAEVEATETATTVIHLGKNDIDRFKVVVPEGSVNVAFAETCQAWYNQIVSNRKQSRSLAKLRDTLIPRLLSGSN
jgi:type I restriction enzyme S subunit